MPDKPSLPDWISALAAAVGAIFIPVGLFFTAMQVSEGTQQLQASTLYTIQSDGRALFKETSGDRPTFDYLFDPVGKADDETLERTSGIMARQVIQYYGSIYSQIESNLLNERYFPTYAQELCSFMNLPRVRRRFEPGLDKAAWTSCFKAVVRSCWNEGAEIEGEENAVGKAGSTGDDGDCPAL